MINEQCNAQEGIRWRAEEMPRGYLILSIFYILKYIVARTQVLWFASKKVNVQLLGWKKSETIFQLSLRVLWKSDKLLCTKQHILFHVSSVFCTSTRAYEHYDLSFRNSGAEQLLALQINLSLSSYKCVFAIWIADVMNKWELETATLASYFWALSYPKLLLSFNFLTTQGGL